MSRPARTAPAARRSAMARSILGQGQPRLERLQGHLAPAAQGQRRRPFRAPHRLRARRLALSDLGRPAEVRPRRRTSAAISARCLRLTKEGAARAGQSVGLARRGRGRILDASATAIRSASPSPPTGGCGRAKWARKGGDELNLIVRGQELRLAAAPPTARIMTAATSPTTRPATGSSRPRCGGTRRSRPAGC